MEYKDIKDLAALMKEMGLTSLAYRNGDESVKLTRRDETRAAPPPSAKTAQFEQRSEEPAPGGAFEVKSPMVGVFYAAPGADEKPYVALGDKVRVGDVLCVIEAMKIMNEITAEREGVISEICTQNKQLVEFGQALFRISAADGE